MVGNGVIRSYCVSSNKLSGILLQIVNLQAAKEIIDKKIYNIAVYHSKSVYGTLLLNPAIAVSFSNLARLYVSKSLTPALTDSIKKYVSNEVLRDSFASFEYRNT